MFPLKTIGIGVAFLLLGAVGFIYVVARPKPQTQTLAPEPIMIEAAQSSPEANPEATPEPSPALEESPSLVPSVKIVHNSSTVVSSQEPPIKQFSVRLLQPAMAATFTSPATIKFTAAANPMSGLRAIEYYVAPEGHSVCQSLTTPDLEGLEKIGEATSSPYEFTWKNATKGNFTVMARAMYDSGEQQLSPPSVIIIKPAEDLNGENWIGWRPPYSVREIPNQLASLMPAPTPTPQLKDCPGFSLNAPDSATPNELITASISSRDLSPGQQFDWHTSGGTIVTEADQSPDKDTVHISTAGVLERSIVISAEVRNLNGICPATASKTVRIIRPSWLNREAVNFLMPLKSRLEDFVDQLRRSEDVKGYVVVHSGNDSCVAGAELTDLNLIKKYLVQLRGVRSDRLTTLNGGPSDPSSEPLPFEFVTALASDPLPARLASGKRIRPCREQDFSSAAVAYRPKVAINRACPDVAEKIAFSSDMLALPVAINTCPYNSLDPQNSITRIRIQDTARGLYSDYPNFKFWATGGEVTTDGQSAIWDLSSVRLKAGPYTVIGQADDGCACSSIRTANVNVTNFCTPCLTLKQTCPIDVQVIDDSSRDRILKDGPAQTFEATVGSFATAGATNLNWTTSKGKIVEGQGTNRIVVDTSRYKPGEKYTVTVSVGGLQRYCVNQLSFAATVGECIAVPIVQAAETIGPAGGRRARRQAPGSPTTSESTSEVPAVGSANLDIPAEGPPTKPRPNETEWMKISWEPRIHTDETVTVRVVYNRTTGKIDVTDGAGNVAQELKLSRPLKEWFGPDYEVLGEVRLRTAGLKCDYCNQEQYQSFDKDQLEWSWPLKPEAHGSQSFNLELWVKGVPRDGQSGKQPKAPEKVWSRNDLRVQVSDRLLTKTTVFAGSALFVVLGLGFSVRGLKIYRIGDTYNVGQAVAVGRNVTMTNTTVNQQKDNIQTGDQDDAR